MRKLTLSLCCMAVTAMLFCACKDNDGKDDKQVILKPIAGHIVGKWKEESVFKTVDGKQEIVQNKKEHATIYIFRQDGTMIRMMETNDDGQTHLASMSWSADDNAGTFTLNGAFNATLVRLDENTLEFKTNQAYDSEIGQTIEDEYHWHYVRIDENELTKAEILTKGRWVFTETYEKINGEWKKSDLNVPDESWHEFYEDGNMQSYARKDGKEESRKDNTWSINNTTGELVIYEDDKAVITIPTEISADGNTLTMHYSDNYNTATGQITKGDFKDVFILKAEQ